MANISYPSPTMVKLSLKRGLMMFTYNLSIGTTITDMQYEMNGALHDIASAKLTKINKDNDTVELDTGDVVDLNIVYKIGNRADSIMSIEMDDLDVAGNDKYLDETGERVALGTVRTNIIIGADPIMYPDPGDRPPDVKPDVDEKKPIDEGDYEPLVFEEDSELKHDLIYDQHIQKISFIQANMAAVFREWFTSFFQPTYFRHVRMKSESTFVEFKSFMKDIYHKEAPILVIDPNTIEHVDDFLFGTNVVNRYNMVDPGSDNIGAKLLYSLAMVETDKIKLQYRRNRYRFRFDVMIMERSMNRALDLFNYLIMNMRHNSKFMLFRRVANLIPSHMIRSIAKINGFNKPDEKFLEWINARAIGCSITTRTLPNGQVMFFAEQDCHIQVEVPDMPAHDNPEQADAIELGARVTDSFIFTVDLPAEFFCTMDHSVVKNYLKYQEGDDPDVHYITTSESTNWENDMQLEVGDYTLFNRVDVTIQHPDDNTLNLLGVLDDVDPQTMYTAKALIEDKNTKLPEQLFYVRIYKGNRETTDFSLSDNGLLCINNPDYTKIYHIYVYVNQKYINMYATALNTKWVGTIQKTDY